MEGLFLSNNKLHGSIPSKLLHSGMEQLKQIFVHGNLLSGTVPVGLADLPNLKNLFIDDNKFTGTMPPEICKLNLNEAFFQPEVLLLSGDDRKSVDTEEKNDGIDVRNLHGNHRSLLDLETERTGCNSIACPAGYRSSEVSIMFLDVDLFTVHSSK